MLKRNKGLTLAELILALGLMVLVSAIVGKYIIDAFKDTTTVTNQIMLQTTVSALMNDIERNISEADLPVLTDDSDDLVEAGLEKIIKIRKPNGKVISYYFDPEVKIITCTEIDKNNNIISTTTFVNIVKFYIEKVDDNGLIIEVRAEYGNSNYELKNTYYTRNTISSSEI